MPAERPAHRRATVVLIGAATAFSLLGDQVLYSVLPVYHVELGLSGMQVGVLLAVNRLVRMVTNPLAHWLAVRMPQRVVFVGAFALGILTTAAYALTSLFTVLLGARLAWGLAWSFIRHYGVQSLMNDVPASAAGSTMGLYNGIARAGSVAGLFGGAVLVDLAGFVPGMLWLAALSLPAMWLAARGFVPFAVSPPPGASRPAVAGRLTGLAWRGFVLGLAGPGLVTSTVGAAVATYSASTGGPLSAATGVLSAATLTGALLAVRYVVESLAAPVLGAFSDRVGAHRAGITCFASGGICLLVAAGGVGGWLFAVCVTAFFVAATTLQATVAGQASQHGSRAFAGYVTASDLGAALGPLAGWWLIGATGDPATALTAAGIAYLTALPGVLRR